MTENNENQNSGKPLSFKLILRSLLGILVFVVIIFLAAGRLDYWQGWVYNGINICALVITFFALSNKPELIRERLKPGKGMKRWDKIYFIISTPAFILGILFACLDAGRLGWSSQLPVFVYVISILVYILGQGIFIWAKRANAFFSTVVRIQKERGHTVCQDGPYGFVRHPGYVGGILYSLSGPLVLGSLWALIPTALGLVLIIIRTFLEDKTLQEELTGYVEYSQKVKYKLIPGIW